MPIRLAENMPVLEKLERENIFVMPEQRAAHQDIRQLKIAVVNIMPKKEKAAAIPNRGIFSREISCFTFCTATAQTGAIAMPSTAQVEGLR